MSNLSARLSPEGRAQALDLERQIKDLKEQVEAPPPAGPTWVSLTTLGTNVAAGRGVGYPELGPSALLDANGIVHLRGAIYFTNTNLNSQAKLTMPVDMRPAQRIWLKIWWGTSAATLPNADDEAYMADDGILYTNNSYSASDWILLDGLSYSLGT